VRLVGPQDKLVEFRDELADSSKVADSPDEMGSIDALIDQVRQ
jgi:hypothetical protein